MSIFREHKTTADRSASDRSRHKRKIEKAIRDGITDIVADESIIGHDGKKKIKIPVRGIKEWQFVYGDNEGHKQVGSAPGQDVQKGQVVKKGQQQQGQGNKAGKDKGEEMYEVEISLEELAEYLFDSLRLPDLEKKKFQPPDRLLIWRGMNNMVARGLKRNAAIFTFTETITSPRRRPAC